MRAPTLGERLDLPTSTTTTTTTTVPGSVPVPEPADGFILETPWESGGAIDPRYTCDGGDVSPELGWTTPPEGTVELALIVTDQNADATVHWVVAGIEPSSGQQPDSAEFVGGIEGVNDFGEVGWTGPCPVAGELPHTYQFRLVALSDEAQLPDPFDADDLLAVPQRDPIAVTESTGNYP